MALFTNVILLALLHIAFAKDCIINMPERMAFEEQLENDLTCDIQRYEPPKNTSNLIVNVKFILKRFNLNSNTGVFSTQTWMYISWTDERLKWDPEKYYGIESTNIISMHIWNPGFVLLNSADSNDFDRFYYVRCSLNNFGDVHCILRITHNARCSIQLKNWPYDQQECSLEFGAWGSKSDHFKMNFSARAMSMLGAEYEAEWFISDYRQESNQSAEGQLKMIFVLEREAAGLAAIVVYPTVILSVLSVTSLFLDVRRGYVRLSISCFSLLGHYYFLKELAAHLPKQNFDPPNLLLYYRGSVVLTVLIILFTFLLMILCKLKSTPQNYVITLNDAVFEGFWKYFIIPQWKVDDDTITDIKRFSPDWTKFANIMNCTFSVVIIVAYVNMYCVLVPRPIPINY